MESMERLPIACTLESKEFAERVAVMERDLFSRSLAVEMIEGGLRHRFAADTGLLPELISFIAAETACCAFLTFRLTFEPAQGPISLDITGPADARELILTTFGGTA